ncbi:HAD family hydrolase [Ferrimonas aestuarii]|uniref:HAD family hydrolase n=1 Tax=Ferrimonas aestuarii TaxID=2569539 RepID=A0A4U1BME5_9GAMM|nr:HAD-IA family hydrolase [Ferrimonas aestuarii]TKB54484.1 HAD family hydrolase [Ferrimonas aestuarii]
MTDKLVIFDWDGTLMDSVARIVDCWQRAAAELELEHLSADTVKGVIGLSVEAAIDTLYPGLDATTADRFKDRYRDWYLNLSEVETPLFSDAESTLVGLQQRGFTLAVATGKGRQGLDRVLDASGLGHYFAATITPTEAASKPDPQMINQLRQRLGVEAQHTYMVGDAGFDLAMANNADVNGIGVSFGAASVEKLLEYRPIKVVDSLTDLLTVLD